MINYELARFSLPHISTKRIRRSKLDIALCRPDADAYEVIPPMNASGNLETCGKYFSDFDAEFRPDLHSAVPLNTLLAKVQCLERRLARMTQPASRPESNVLTETLLKKVQNLTKEIKDAVRMSIAALEDADTPEPS